MGSNVTRDIDRSLYLQLLRGHMGYFNPRKRLSRHRLIVLNILW